MIVWIVLMCLLVVGAILGLCVGIVLLLTIFSSAPWVPTPRRIAEAMVREAQLRPGQRVMDLGCGDASLLIAAATQAGVQAVGIELNWGLVWYARYRVWRAGVADRVEIRQGNVFTAELPDADAVLLYMLPKAMTRLERRLQERYDHLRVVSHGFLFATEPVRTVRAGEATIRVYEW